jgi:carboxypeptidase Q
MRYTAALLTLLSATTAAQAPEHVDVAMVARIKQEGLTRSQVMDHLGWLSDVYGPRVTGSPALADASAWAMKTLTGWGLVNAHQERFTFGHGWTVERFSIHLLEPQTQPLIGYPRAWTIGTPGPITGDVIAADLRSPADFERYRGTLKGKVVLTQSARPVPMLDGRVVLRMTDTELQEAATVLPAGSQEAGRDRTFPGRLQAFLAAEGALAALDRGSDEVIAEGGAAAAAAAAPCAADRSAVA